MFYVTAAVYTVGAVAFCILASGCIQPWALDVAVLPPIDTVLVDMELEGTDALLEHEKHPSGSVPNPSSERTEMVA